MSAIDADQQAKLDRENEFWSALRDRVLVLAFETTPYPNVVLLAPEIYDRLIVRAASHPFIVTNGFDPATIPLYIYSLLVEKSDEEAAPEMRVLYREALTKHDPAIYFN